MLHQCAKWKFSIDIKLCRVLLQILAVPAQGRSQDDVKNLSGNPNQPGSVMSPPAEGLSSSFSSVAASHADSPRLLNSSADVMGCSSPDCHALGQPTAAADSATCEVSQQSGTPQALDGNSAMMAAAPSASAAAVQNGSPIIRAVRQGHKGNAVTSLVPHHEKSRLQESSVDDSFAGSSALTSKLTGSRQQGNDVTQSPARSVPPARRQ